MSLPELSKDANEAIQNLDADVSNLLSSVMGPDHANAAKSLMTEDIALKLKGAMIGTLTPDKVQKLSEIINKFLVAPATKKVLKDSKKEVDSIKRNIKDSRQAAEDIAKIAANTTGTNANKTSREKAVDKMVKINKDLADLMSNRNICETQIQAKNKRMTELTIKYDTLTNSGKDELTSIKERVQDLKTAMASVDQDLVKVHDNTVGGQATIAKMTKQALKLPDNLEKTTAKAISNALKIYMRHRAHEY